MFNTNFKGHTRREFKYTPRFYDEQKEALQQKVRLKKAENKADDDERTTPSMHRERLSEAFSSARTVKQQQEEKRDKLSAQLRRLALIFAFFLGLYWAANEYLPDFLNYLTNGSLEVRTEELKSMPAIEGEEEMDYSNPIRHR